MKNISKQIIFQQILIEYSKVFVKKFDFYMNIIHILKCFVKHNNIMELT